jgi:uncharacterized oligopeptide transporter (OPT) family protein
MGGLIAMFWYLHMPFLMIGVASGFSSPIPVGIMMLLGLLVKRILMKYMGRKWVLRYRAIIVAGLVLGEGLASILGIASIVIIKGTWGRPF